MDNPQALAIGTRLAGEYRVERILGSGGFGITYLAEEETLQRKVAIKEYFPTGLAVREGSILVRSKGDSGKGRYIWGLDRFIHEAQILAKFNHDNIVRVYRYFRENNTAYMVLHYENGQSFKTWLDMLGRAPSQEELDRLLEKLLPALETIHDADFLHRDIAPDNILIREDGAPVLIDFGSARGDVAQHSKTVSAIVKPGYSPFEQYAVNAKQQGPWTDIYSLGATLYYAVSRHRPLDAPGRVTDDNHKSAFKVAKGRYRRSFLRAIDQALRVKPEHRPCHVGEWRDELIGLGNSQTVKTLRTEAIHSRPAGPVLDTERPTRARTRGLGPTALAATMPRVPEFLRRRRAEKQAPEPVPVQLKSEQIFAAEDSNSLALAADSLANRLAEVHPTTDLAEQGGADKAGFADKKKPSHAQRMQRAIKGAQADGAAVITPEIDIPVTRMVHAAATAGSYVKRLVAGIFGLIFRVFKAVADQSTSPPAVGAATAKAARKPVKSVRKKRPAKKHFLPKYLRSHPVMAFSLALIAVGSLAVSQNWIPARYVNQAEATLGDFKRDWPNLRGSIQKSYTSTMESVGKLHRVLVSSPNAPVGNVQVLRGHEGMVQAAIFTPDGKHIISGGIDERLRLWDIASGRLDRILAKEQSSITAIDIRDGVVLVAEASGLVVLKNLYSGKTIKKIRHHNGLVHSVAFGRRNNEFFTAGQDGTVKYWRDKTDYPDLTLENDTGAIHAIAVRPSESLIATAGADRVVKLWDTSRRRLIRKFRGHKRAVSSIDFSPDGRYLVSAGLDGRLKLWSAKSRRTRRTLHGHRGRIFMVKFSPDGTLLASAGEDGTVRLWNVRRRKLLRTFRGHQGPVRSVSFSADGRKVVSGSDDGTVRIWTVRPSSHEIARR